MCRPLFGQLLGKIIPLSEHDIAEIIEEQGISHRRFGEIALAFQLCRPQDVWQAWWAQLGDAPELVTLSSIGIDTQALAFMPRDIAESYNVIPVRAYGDQIVIAATEKSRDLAMRDLPSLLQKDVRFVLASESQIRDAIGAYYLREAV